MTNSLATTAPIVNCQRGIKVLWPKYHGLVKQGLILHSLVKMKADISEPVTRAIITQIAHLAMLLIIRIAHLLYVILSVFIG